MKKKESKDLESPTLFENFELIYKINIKIREWQRKILSEFDLTIPQYCVIKHLGALGGLTFKDLAEKCNITRSTMTGIIDILEIKKKLVIRKDNPDDRRSLFVILTEKGKELYDTLPLQNYVFKNYSAGLNPEEIHQLNILLKKFFNNFN